MNIHIIYMFFIINNHIIVYLFNNNNNDNKTVLNYSSNNFTPKYLNNKIILVKTFCIRSHKINVFSKLLFKIFYFLHICLIIRWFARISINKKHTIVETCLSVSFLEKDISVKELFQN